MSVEVRQSGIHGRGLYAAAPIREGDIVVAWNNTRELTKAEYQALDQKDLPYVDFDGKQILLIGEPERYINHSCDPNTEPGSRCDIAKRDIARGEEITTDYSAFYIPGGQMTCGCGRPNCRKIIYGKIAPI